MRCVDVDDESRRGGGARARAAWFVLTSIVVACLPGRESHARPAAPPPPLRLASARPGAIPVDSTTPPTVPSRLLDARLAGDAGTGPSRAVRPFVGTAGYGYTFPGASVPFGMVQWSPDTLHPSPGGYRYADARLRGFSLTHLSGVGCPTQHDLPFLPVVGSAPAALAAHRAGVGFSHAAEEAAPGYYRARLASGIDVRLTATRRTGLARFAYPRTTAARLLLDGGGSANGASAAALRVVGPDEVRGWVTSGGFCAHNRFPYTLYVDVRLNRPIRRVDAWDGAALHPGQRAATGLGAALVLGFDARRDPVVLVKVGISYVDPEGARRNLRAEDPGSGGDVAGVRRAATATWNSLLGRIRVAGGTPTQTQVFYTALYHALLAPTTASDTDGRYRGLDDRVHRAQGHTRYTAIAGWDIYRGEMQLLALLAPDVASDVARSLLGAAHEGGWLPKWLLANRSLNEMVGDPADPLLADAYAFGARGFDAHGALAHMVIGATRVGVGVGGYVERPGLADYLSLGYLPQTRHGGGGPVSATLEYALDDFAIARLAEAMHERATATRFLRRAQAWRTLYNPATGYIEPRWPDGTWRPDFVPADPWLYTEGNAAQYAWFVPHDLGDLIAAMGGDALVQARLDTFFTRLNAGPSAPYAWMGNEPSLLVPWAYTWAGAPWKTQAVVRRIMTDLYGAGPGGLPGNDDLGTMSAWYVWAALGLYPAVPGTDILVLHGPLFPQAHVSVPGVRLFTIEGRGAEAGSPYVRAVALDGRAQAHAWLPLGALHPGTTLHVALGPTPNVAWGAARADAPPSFGLPAPRATGGG